MSIIKDATKVQDMMLRVYNNTMIKEDLEKDIMGDEKAIKALCEKVFGDGSVTPDPAILHQFNNIVVKVADKVAETDLQKMLSYFANIQNVPANTQLVEYRQPHPRHLKFKWSAIGSDVALKRVETGEADFIRIDHMQTGISYNPLTQSERCVENFRALVNDTASAKLRMIYETIMAMIEKAVATGDIPAKQTVVGSNVAYSDFSKVASILARRSGGRPVYLADRIMIDDMATKIGTDATTLLVDTIKDSMYNYELTNLRCADALPIVNEFTTRKGFETQFPVGAGYLVASGANSRKAFEVALAGGLVQHTENDFIHGTVKMVIRQAVGMDLLASEMIGCIKDTDLTI